MGNIGRKEEIIRRVREDPFAVPAPPEPQIPAQPEPEQVPAAVPA